MEPDKNSGDAPFPLNTDYLKKQWEHEPTRRYVQELWQFALALPSRIILEIGTGWGLSGLVFLHANPGAKVFGVDKDASNYGIKQIRASEHTGRYQYYEMPSATFWQNNKKPYDLIYVDGSHAFQDCYADFQQAWKSLIPTGWLMLDDFGAAENRTGEYGISFALALLLLELEQKPENFRIGRRLIAIQKPRQPKVETPPTNALKVVTP